MSTLPEHTHRRNTHKQPRPTSHWSRDVSDTRPHPGPIASCGKCRGVGA